jgi:hypothetical protein
MIWLILIGEVKLTTHFIYLFDKVEFPTRFQNTAISVIDNIFIDFTRQGNFVIFPIYNVFSDHDA